jgi:hypothetical protein
VCTKAHGLPHRRKPVAARRGPFLGEMLPPGVPYLTPARSAAPDYIDPHLRFVPTNHEHQRAMCASNDYTTVTDGITPAHLIHVDMMDLCRIFWLIELNGDLRDLCRVDRTVTYNEPRARANSPTSPPTS